MFDNTYYDWDGKRIKAITEFYTSKWFYFKTVLDLGCGYASISSTLHRLGSDVTALDSRQEHIKVISKKNAGIKTIKHDLDRGLPFINKRFDLVLDLGLICHLNNWETHLRDICKITTHLVLETAVLDSDDPFKSVSIPENKGSYDLSMNGLGSRASASAIERVLKDCGMNFRRLDRSNLNSGNYKYDWQPKNNDDSSINNRRIWFAVKANSPQQFAHQSDPPPVIIHSNIPVSQLSNQENNKPSIVETPKPTIHITSVATPTIITNNEPRVAVVLSGHLRVAEKTYKTFIKQVGQENYNKMDVFCYFWSTMGAPQVRDRQHDNSINNIPTESKLGFIHDVIKPKVLKIVDYNSVVGQIKQYSEQAKISQKEKDGFYGNHLVDFISMLYGNNEVKNLLEKYEQDNNFKYDCIIRSRTDIVWLDKLDYRSLNMKDSTCFTPNIAFHYHNGCNDQVAIGNSQVIKSYLSLYQQVIGYLNNRSINPLRPETLLRYHLSKNQIKISSFNCKYYLLRASGAIVIPWDVGSQRTVFDQNLLKGILD